MPETSVEFRRDRQSSPDRKMRGQPGVVHYPFWFGGSASSFAACVTHPLDLVKVRLQTQGNSRTGPRRNMVGMFVHVVRSNGVFGLYSGLSASLLRQMTYSTTRFGIYEYLKERMTARHAGSAPSVLALIGLSSTAGLVGGMAGTPADVINVRMQNDAGLPAAERRNYKHAIDGLVRIARDEGVASLWRGAVPNAGRAALMTASQLASYDAFKQMLIAGRIPFGGPKGIPIGRWKDDLITHFTASFLAGFVATTVCSPVDVLKTRIMNAQGKSQGLLKIVADVYKAEGLSWMFKGWVPSFIRLGPHTIATFLFLEQHKKLYRRMRRNSSA